MRLSAQSDEEGRYIQEATANTLKATKTRTPLKTSLVGCPSSSRPMGNTLPNSALDVRCRNFRPSLLAFTNLPSPPFPPRVSRSFLHEPLMARHYFLNRDLFYSSTR